jgi:hypothetical protein
MTTADLEQQLETYAELRGALGFALGGDLKMLQRFVAFAGTTGDSGPVTTRKSSTGLTASPSMEERRLPGA